MHSASSLSKLEQYITVFESELQFMTKIAVCFGRFLLEVGFDIYGLWTHGGRPVVFLAAPPGPKAIHEHAHFRQDHDYFTWMNSRLLRYFGLQYLGDGHSHHRLGLPQPSGGDVEHIRSIASRNNIPRLIELILTLDDDTDKVRVNPYLFTDAGAGDYVKCQLKVLPGVSPFRQVLEQSREYADSISFSAAMSRAAALLSSEDGHPPASAFTTKEETLERAHDREGNDHRVHKWSKPRRPAACRAENEPLALSRKQKPRRGGPPMTENG